MDFKRLFAQRTHTPPPPRIHSTNSTLMQAKEKAAQYMEARKGLSEKYSRLMEIHRNEQQGYQRSMAELDAEREAWRSTMHKEKEKGRKSK